MSDRTEEIKELREWNTQHGYDADDPSGLVFVVLEMKQNATMLHGLPIWHRDILSLLRRYKAVEMASRNNDKIHWMNTDRGGVNAVNRVYRIKPDYELPDLIEEPKWAEPEVSLRDYFAAKAMCGLNSARPNLVGTHAELAGEAYKSADAMLKARKQGG